MICIYFDFYSRLNQKYLMFLMSALFHLLMYNHFVSLYTFLYFTAGQLQLPAFTHSYSCRFLELFSDIMLLRRSNVQISDLSLMNTAFKFISSHILVDKVEKVLILAYQFVLWCVDLVHLESVKMNEKIGFLQIIIWAFTLPSLRRSNQNRWHTKYSR